MKKVILSSMIVCLFLVSFVLAADEVTLDRSQRLNFGHVMQIKDIEFDPPQLVPGQIGRIMLKIKNNGNFNIKDVRVQLGLPAQAAFLNDISKRKIPTIAAGGTIDLSYQIIILPTATESIYNVTITTDYLNHIGDERQDVDYFGLPIKGSPQIYAIIEDTEIHQGKLNGEVTITFVNNEVADLKFLTVELQETEDYSVISNSKEYIGDLDSDDFESADFHIQVNKKKGDIILPVRATYKDAFNNEFSEELKPILSLRTKKELGIAKSNTGTITTVVIILLIIGYYFYRRYKKKKKGKKG
ncbi:hypothetical protein GOV14_02355 [Candidatus Pacearchaeota archaeon]|nr:hypothetical protein [Candidatus Pacearchaeota archaeon]